MATKTETPRHSDAEMRKVVAKLDPKYTITKGRGGHWKVVEVSTGESVLRDDGSPLVITSSPSDQNAVRVVERELKRYGLLRVAKKGPARAQREHESRPELKVDRAARQEQARQRKIKTDELRKDMEPWIKKLGGWDMRGIKADLAAILVHLYPGQFGSQGSVQSTFTNFVKGDAVGDETRAALHGLNEMFQAAEDVRGLYVDLLRKAKGLEPSLGPVQLKPGQEWPYEIVLLELDKLFADFSYQRPVHEPFVRQLVMTFDERLVGVVDVSERKDGRYAILDGQQRTEAMRQAGKTKAYCALYKGMSASDEAQFFFHKNKDRKGMSAFYGFRARVLAGDKQALAIEKILAENGYKLGPVADQNTVIGSVNAVRDVYLLKSEVRDDCLSPALKVMGQAFRGRKGSVDTEIIRGLGRFFRVFADDEIKWDHWIEALQALGPMLVIGRARDFSSATEKRHHGKSMAMTLVEIHNTGLPLKERLQLKRIEQDDESRRKNRAADTLAA